MDIPESTNFIQDIIVDDLKSGKRDHVLTRFPPEPNGYIHIGHAKSICLNFGTAKKFCGKTNLRFDDTNPTKEDTEYVDSIYNDVHWLGFNWEEPVHYASDYYDQLYDFAEQLIKLGKAYVDDLSPEEMRESLKAQLRTKALEALGEQPILFDGLLTDNFCLMEDGWHFVYSPYEIAGYAAGVVEVVVPTRN